MVKKFVVLVKQKLMDPQTKINCCFADSVYTQYQNKKFGINKCLEKNQDKIEKLSNIKDIYNYHKKTEKILFNEDTNINTETNCNIPSIIEIINRL